MRPAGFIGVVGLIIVGVIIADFLTHPAGTKAAGTGIVQVEKPTLNALLGKTS